MLTPIYATSLSILPFFQIAADLFLFSTMTTQHRINAMRPGKRNTHTYFRSMRCNMGHSMRDPTMLVLQTKLGKLDLLIVEHG